MKKHFMQSPSGCRCPAIRRAMQAEPARSKLLRGVSLCLAAVCLAASVSFQPATAATSMATCRTS